MKIDTREQDGLLFVTVTVPRYNKNNPDTAETNRKIKIGTSDLRRKFPQVAKLSIKEGNTLDNRSADSATWVFRVSLQAETQLDDREPPPAPEKPKPIKKTTTRRRKKKITKKTDTEV